MSALESLVRKALEAGGLRREVEGLKQKLLTFSLSNPDAFAAINTRSQAMFSIFRYLEVVAPTAQPILLQGGTGTGKELLARAVHLLSGRKGNFVPVNLAGVDENAFSDTLFGHVRGAFTGADSVRKGLVATAADGTMFLDEIGDLSESSQIKLLRLLQEGEYYPLGTDQSKTGTARFILATHRDLSKMIHEGKFREDLYYRLFSHRVQIPALSERSEDIPLLVDSFLREASEIMGKPIPESSPELFRLLASYTFPGNIRELKALIMDAVARSDGQVLSMEPFKMVVCSKGDSDNTGFFDSCSEYSLDEGKIPTLKEAESSLIDRALELSNGNQGVAAEMLGISRTALNKRISKIKDRFRNG
jgi:DNA-binding NtrC family response regulator